MRPVEKISSSLFVILCFLGSVDDAEAGRKRKCDVKLDIFLHPTSPQYPPTPIALGTWTAEGHSHNSITDTYHPANEARRKASIKLLQCVSGALNEPSRDLQKISACSTTYIPSRSSPLPGVLRKFPPYYCRDDRRECAWMHTFMAGKMIDKVRTSICRVFTDWQNEINFVRIRARYSSPSPDCTMGLQSRAQSRMPIDHFREFNFYSTYKPDSAFSYQLPPDFIKKLTFSDINKTLICQNGKPVAVRNSIPRPSKSFGLGSSAENSSRATILETNTDRPGSDFRKIFFTSELTAESCAELCKAESQCRSFTYVKPGFQGSNSVCYLKNRIPRMVKNKVCCISGVK